MRFLLVFPNVIGFHVTPLVSWTHLPYKTSRSPNHGSLVKVFTLLYQARGPELTGRPVSFSSITTAGEGLGPISPERICNKFFQQSNHQLKGPVNNTEYLQSLAVIQAALYTQKENMNCTSGRKAFRSENKIPDLPLENEEEHWISSLVHHAWSLYWT